MDEICVELSAKLTETAANGYVVFFEEELLEVIPENTRNRETLEAALKLLSSGGYIDVKYARGSAFCIASLKAYTLPDMPEQTETLQFTDDCKTQVRLPFFVYLIVTLCAFLGGLAGTLIGAVI